MLDASGSVDPESASDRFGAPPPYGGACLDHLVPALREVLAGGARPGFLPAGLEGVTRIVLLVLDGLGSRQLERFADWAPRLAAAPRTSIRTVLPATTAAALTSLSTGVPPAAHGLVGYRMFCAGAVLNVLRWTTADGDARERLVPERLQPMPAFGGEAVPVVTKADFAGSGFTRAHLGGAPLLGWREPAEIAPLSLAALAAGRRLVYAYFDGVDHAAHEHGLGPQYEAALREADAVAAGIACGLPPGSALVVTADHGHLLRPCRPVELDASVRELVLACSGEGRFRWLHALPGAAETLESRAAAVHGQAAHVLSRAACIERGLLGSPGDGRHGDRLGDVLLVPRGDDWFLDPADTGEGHQVSRHGGVDPDETDVPVVVLGR